MNTYLLLKYIHMAKMAQTAHAHGTALPDSYERYRRWWEGLGYPAFVSMVGVFYLMVAKPEIWG